MKKIVLVIALCASLPGLVFAQQRPGSLRGQVLDELGGAIVGGLATVTPQVMSSGHGALHLSGASFVMSLVRRYMPGRMFWVYGVGCALIEASLSMATNVAVRWSGLLFGLMMFLFVAQIHLPGALRLSRSAPG